MYSASMSQPPVHADQSVNGSNTDPAPVLVNGNFASSVGVSGNTGQIIKTAITNWRKTSRNIGGYTVIMC